MRKPLYCNCCGKQIWVEQEMVREGAVQVEKEWDYFSGKDGEIHSFCLCEDCYDKIRKNFKIPVEVRQIESYL